MKKNWETTSPRSHWFPLACQISTEINANLSRFKKRHNCAPKNSSVTTSKTKTPFIHFEKVCARSKISQARKNKMHTIQITASKWRRRLLYYYYIQRQCRVWSVHFPPESEVRAVDDWAAVATIAVPSGTSVDTVGIVSSRQSTIYSIVSGYDPLQYLLFFGLFLTCSSTSSLVASAPSFSS